LVFRKEGIFLNNEKGNTLLTVLVTSLVMVTIGLAIVASTIGGAKRTEVRETDINITYDAKKVADEIATKLSFELSEQELAIDNLTPTNINHKLANFLKTEILNQYVDHDTVSCINVVDVSNSPSYLIPSNPCLGDDLSHLTPFNIETSTALTRVLEIVVSTKNPESEQGVVSRTVTKRIILSPLPSFLKYAVGAGGELKFNGSPHIVGDIYANKLAISKDAHYRLSDEKVKQIQTPLPSVIGSVYTRYFQQTFEDFQNLLLDEDAHENFYKSKYIPGLKSDSQFTDIDFDETYKTELSVMLSNDLIGLTIAQNTDITNLSQMLNSAIHSKYTFHEANLPSSISPPTEPIDKNIDTMIAKVRSLQNNAVGTSGYKLIDSNVSGLIQVPGNLMVTSLNKDINISGNLVVDGDLYVIGNKSVTIDNIIATGDIYLINLKNELTINGKIISAGETVMEGNSSLTLLDDIFSTGPMTIKVNNSTTNVKGNIITHDNLKIQGNNDEHNNPENDEISFGSVIYTKGKSLISNLNIIGGEDNKQLILFSGGNLMMTRMNEFSNFYDSNETEPFPKNFSALSLRVIQPVKPLKAFLYTDKNAELYGVGSLFFINGGIFAGETLEINAIRGKIDSINEADRFSSNIQQEDHFSRFTAYYNREILLQNIESLPKVDRLSLFSDEVVVK
jgi:hypothetical protein